MQPEIAEIKYFSSTSLEGLAEEISAKITNKKEQWLLYGDLKCFDGLFVQTLVRTVTEGDC